jgi:hypothetical protein
LTIFRIPFCYVPNLRNLQLAVLLEASLGISTDSGTVAKTLVKTKQKVKNTRIRLEVDSTIVN